MGNQPGQFGDDENFNGHNLDDVNALQEAFDGFENLDLIMDVAEQPRDIHIHDGDPWEKNSLSKSSPLRKSTAPNRAPPSRPSAISPPSSPPSSSPPKSSPMKKSKSTSPKAFADASSPPKSPTHSRNLTSMGPPSSPPPSHSRNVSALPTTITSSSTKPKSKSAKTGKKGGKKGKKSKQAATAQQFPPPRLSSTPPRLSTIPPQQYHMAHKKSLPPTRIPPPKPLKIMNNSTTVPVSSTKYNKKVNPTINKKPKSLRKDSDLDNIDIYTKHGENNHTPDDDFDISADIAETPQSKTLSPMMNSTAVPPYKNSYSTTSMLHKTHNQASNRDLKLPSHHQRTKTARTGTVDSSIYIKMSNYDDEDEEEDGGEISADIIFEDDEEEEEDNSVDKLMVRLKFSPYERRLHQNKNCIFICPETVTLGEFKRRYLQKKLPIVYPDVKTRPKLEEIVLAVDLNAKPLSDDTSLLALSFGGRASLLGGKYTKRDSDVSIGQQNVTLVMRRAVKDSGSLRSELIRVQIPELKAYFVMRSTTKTTIKQIKQLIETKLFMKGFRRTFLLENVSEHFRAKDGIQRKKSQVVRVEKEEDNNNNKYSKINMDELHLSVVYPETKYLQDNEIAFEILSNNLNGRKPPIPLQSQNLHATIPSSPSSKKITGMRVLYLTISEDL